MFSGLLSHSAAPAADFSRLQRASITFRDVAKRYGDHQVLNAINLQVEPGEVVAILGPSGSGKSTLIRLINQLESLSGGEILIDGKPTSRLSGSALRQLRSRVGFVFQQFNLYAHLTAQENITLALERVHGWGKSAAQERALALRRQVGLEEKAQQMPAQLSGGQQQRVGVARALAADPEVLLMDEPFGALDPVTREALQQEMLRIHRLLGRTIVLVTHDIDEALRLADHLVLMDGGEVVQQGAPLEMLLRPKNSFVQTFFGRSELGVRLLSLREVGDDLRPDERLAGEGLTVTMTLREALSQYVARRCETLPVVDAEGRPCGTLHFADLLRQEMSHEGAS